MELALSHRAFAEEARGDARTPRHLVGQRQADRDRQSAAHDRIAAVKARGGVEQMHRAAAPAAASFLLAVHLGHHGSGGDARAPAHGHARGKSPRSRRRAPAPASCRRRSLLRRCTDARSRGFCRRGKLPRTSPRSGGSGSSGAAASGSDRVRGCVGRNLRGRTSGSLALQRRGVAFGEPEFAGFEQAAHDLTAARLRYIGDKVDLAGRHHRAQPLAREAEQVAAQCIARRCRQA